MQLALTWHILTVLIETSIYYLVNKEMYMEYDEKAKEDTRKLVYVVIYMSMFVALILGLGPLIN